MTTSPTKAGAPLVPGGALLPCPFCGGGQTSIRENGKVWLGMRYSAPSSVSVWHHCALQEGQPHRGIERVGRDLASAVAAWNTRSAAVSPEERDQMKKDRP